MAEDIALEVQGILIEAWRKFFDECYNKLAPEYPTLWGFNTLNKLNKKGAEESHWICWNEYDLMFHIGRVFYNILSAKKEAKYSNIQIHFEKNVNHNNFKGYEFEDRLGCLKKKLGMKRGPKIDMIIAYEDKNDRFLLCAEVKYFHGRPYECPIQQIERDIKKLKAIRSCNIAEKAVFMLLDDYYFYTNEDDSKKIREHLRKIKSDEGEIIILSGNTEAKLQKYK